MKSSRPSSAHTPPSPSRIILVGCWAIALTSILDGASCASPSSDPFVVGDDTDAGGSGVFVTPDASNDVAVESDSASTAKLCNATGETPCPAPYGTCGAGKCTTDLSSDIKNCGSCENNCFGDLSLVEWHYILHIDPSCVNGQCTMLCDTSVYPFYRDCNGRSDDGCELDVQTDPQNCGACGNVCPSGTRCVAGQCGCPPGQTLCESNADDLGPDTAVDQSTNPPTYFRCVDLKTDMKNCGACRSPCTDSSQGACATPPPHTKTTCAGGTCGHSACERGWTDCDNDLGKGCESNGCETLTDFDSKNCGACGHACAPGQRCINNRDDGKGPRCLCAPNETLCDVIKCVDLTNDVDHCGACGNRCPGWAAPNSTSVCNAGICDTQCKEGFGDCDGDKSNGCETNVMVDETSCGACGHRCDTAAGQPCFQGACLMTECDAGVQETR